MSVKPVTFIGSGEGTAKGNDWKNYHIRRSSQACLLSFVPRHLGSLVPPEVRSDGGDATTDIVTERRYEGGTGRRHRRGDIRLTVS